ncbi:MAG: TetR family transcriptional regulator C-terminal domain-containing protein [Gammaproteobacteria bacterium]|nr:MAG: TetR family transcriptional regulator [Gammaproteobacteria bacterium]UCH38563.1 MAG: TetR family transcriptional regulator C-terminal domain-containing protein [Gammaproteobacteria bacterium]
MSKRTIAYRRKTAEQRQQELIAAGITCLGKGGISAFTIDRICREANVSRGLVNHHFKSKEDLLVRIYAEMTAHLVDDMAQSDARAQLLSIVETSFAASSFNTSNLRAWLAIWAEVGNNEALSALHRSRYHSYTIRIAAALDDIAASKGFPINSTSLARQVVALIDGLWLEYCLHSEGFSLADAKQDCLDLLLAYGIDLTGVSIAAGADR